MNIGDRSKSVTVASLCRALKMSRQNWYKGRVLRRRRQVDENLVVHLVKGERKLQNRLGTLCRPSGDGRHSATAGLQEDRT